MGPEDEESNGKDRDGAGSRSWTYVLLGLIAMSVVIAGLAIFGSGKFGWPVVVLVLAYVFYRYVPFR